MENTSPDMIMSARQEGHLEADDGSRNILNELIESLVSS